MIDLEHSLSSMTSMRRLSFLQNGQRLTVFPFLSSTDWLQLRRFAARPATSAKKPKKEQKKEEPKKEETKVKKVSGYGLFLRDNLKKYKEDGSSFAEATRAAAKKWESTPVQVRQKYNDEAMELNKPHKPPPVEKAPPSAYIVFYKTVLPAVTKQYPDASFGEKGRIIGEMWRRLDPEEKSKRQKLAAEAIREFKAKQVE